MGRPKKNISAKAVFELAKLACTQEEMGRVLGCDPTTIGRRFAAEIARGNAHLRKRLRREQIKAALSGNVTMLIWLGKQLLGQSDKSKTEITGEVVSDCTQDFEQMSMEESDVRLRELLIKAGVITAAEIERADRTPCPAAEKTQEPS